MPAPAALAPIAARRRRSSAETLKDLAWLQWLGRFRFVTAALMAWRFEVSVQKARRRLVRLVDAGVVSAHSSGFGEPRLFVLAAPGAMLVGYPPRRRAPRPEIHRVHELAIAQLVASLELNAPSTTRVLTERDCRWHTAAGPVSYSVVLRGDRGETNDRWTDVAVVTPLARVAVEIELAPKHTARLARIVRGYLRSDYDEVRFLVASPALARRLDKIDRAQRVRLGLDHSARSTRVVIDAWPHTSDTQRLAIRTACGWSAVAGGVQTPVLTPRTD